MTIPNPTTSTTALSVSEQPSLIVFIGRNIKDFLQMLIAINIIGILILKILYVTGWNACGILSTNWFSHQIEPIFHELKTLEIVAKALAYSAGVDLAYMLLTPGPDEAIEPLILGLASALLFSISSIGDTNIMLALEIGLYVIILGILFIMKSLFIKEDPSQNTHPLISLVKTKAKDAIDHLRNLIKI